MIGASPRAPSGCTEDRGQKAEDRFLSFTCCFCQRCGRGAQLCVQPSCAIPSLIGAEGSGEAPGCTEDRGQKAEDRFLPFTCCFCQRCGRGTQPFSQPPAPHQPRIETEARGRGWVPLTGKSRSRGVWGEARATKSHRRREASARCLRQRGFAPGSLLLSSLGRSTHPVPRSACSFKL